MTHRQLQRWKDRHNRATWGKGAWLFTTPKGITVLRVTVRGYSAEGWVPE